MDCFDYVVVGAGAAGCVLPNRLSADSATKMLLLEAGPRDTNPNIHRPAGLFKLFDGSLTWNYQTVPQPHLNGRQLSFVQGRVLGGGSSINGQVFTRGCPQDYDRWVNEYGGSGWSFADVLPYFKRSERNDSITATHGSRHGTN